MSQMNPGDRTPEPSTPGARYSNFAPRGSQLPPTLRRVGDAPLLATRRSAAYSARVAGHLDVIVIGGGIAGVAAALESAAAGAVTAVVRAGPGATALASGAWHGPLPSLLGEALAAAGLPHLPVDTLLPHPFGDLRPADNAPATHAAARIDEAACVCGIAGLPHFPAAALARMWRAPRHVTLALPETPAAGWSPVALAAALERDPAGLIAALRQLGAGTRAILPAVLGLDPLARTAERVAAAAGVDVAEALGVPPSVPGWRLDRTLVRVLERSGVTLLEGRVVDRAVQDDVVLSVRVAVRGEPVLRELAAAAFVLATGRFVGGGIAAADGGEEVDVARGQALREASLVERALGCDVWIEHLGDRFREVQPVPLTDPVRAEPQALLRAGVHVDAAGRPRDVQDQVRYRNVTARGAVVAATSHGLGRAAAGAAGGAA
ncbi:MAG: FAD-dependent oxidoreductase [Gemmatimonadetes bacterium]|nr:FAD-dependent oxidoreductase [Gemmatimonadota bacterium]